MFGCIARCERLGGINYFGREVMRSRIPESVAENKFAEFGGIHCTDFLQTQRRETDIMTCVNVDTMGDRLFPPPTAMV
jgi:hypothetical protein